MAIRLWPTKDIRVRKVRIGRIPALILTPQEKRDNVPGVLWMHGGGYMTGMKEMVYMSRALDLVRSHGAVVLSLLPPAPSWRLIRRQSRTATRRCCI